MNRFTLHVLAEFILDTSNLVGEVHSSRGPSRKFLGFATAAPSDSDSDSDSNDDNNNNQ